LISFLRRWAEACIAKLTPGRTSLLRENDRDDTKSGLASAANQQIIAEIQELYRTAVGAETALAFDHKSDPYYTSSRGHNVGRDEMMAVIYAEKIVLTPSAAEFSDPLLYVNRLVADIEVIKADYRVAEDDPDGYGIGTLHSISRKLEPFFETARCLSSGAHSRDPLAPPQDEELSIRHGEERGNAARLEL